MVTEFIRIVLAYCVFSTMIAVAAHYIIDGRWREAFRFAFGATALLVGGILSIGWLIAGKW